MIEVQNLTKRYGATTAVDNLSFAVEPGIVTGFLGPNGAGKSTTMRMILGLDKPTSGTATVNGRSLVAQQAPLTELGALLEAKAVHPKRSGRNHLRALAATTGISKERVEEVLDMVGLSDVADRAAGGFSLGMSQRLGIASALLGDPATIMLDEPVNGLDPEGILWIRHLLKDLANEGRTVLVSSHLMSEMALTAEHFVIIENFEAYIEAEFAHDWARAEAIHGDDTCRDLLERTNAQRRADAFCQMARDGVNSDKPSAPVKRVHNIVYSAETAEELIRRWASGSARLLDPDSYNISDIDGHPIAAGEAFADMLLSSFRRVVQNAANVTINMSPFAALTNRDFSPWGLETRVPGP